MPKEEPIEVPQIQINTDSEAFISTPILRTNKHLKRTETVNNNHNNNDSNANKDINNTSTTTAAVVVDNNSTWIKQQDEMDSESKVINFIETSSPGNNSSNSAMTSPSSGQKSMRRRIRRKNNSPDDQAEALTEMSVRGLNLFRYASVKDGVYQCTECLKENVSKTFKNKYSFQRHAFLYHEGTQRKGNKIK